ncbi:MAG: hypothetical protein M3R35_02495 [Candidatus Eremiobacteraeota bacterium]|nr:hypothetical protein [Candidatus Eremiobacteraeota bacterium]
MNANLRAIVVASILALAACSGNFGTGTSAPGGSIIPPGGPGDNQPLSAPNAAGTGGPGASAAAVATPPSGNTAQLALSDAASGLQCPDLNGYTCLLRFNAPDATPTPSSSTKNKTKPTPTPTPAPTPTPSPSPLPSGALATPSPTPTPAGPTMTLKLAVHPKDAPAMYHPPAGALGTTALMDVMVTPSEKFVLDGNVIAAFTLPKEELPKRGFAVQIFQVQTHKKKSATLNPLYSYNKSSLDGTTLTFQFKPPKIAVPKNSTYLLVLYGDDHPAAASSAAPSASPSLSPSPAPASSPNT